MLELTGMGKVYEARGGGNVIALEQISLAVSAGEFTVVRGPSGSGKTTLLLSSGGLLPPSSGMVNLCGRDVYSLDSSSRASLRAEKIGFVFQQFYLIPYLSVFDNVLVPSLAVEGGEKRDRARELLDGFGLAGRLNHFPAELSTGERQRVGLARAMLNSPALILADEPTGNLDQENSRIVLDTLADFAGRGGAVLMVTHDPQAMSRAANIVELIAGQISTLEGENAK